MKRCVFATILVAGSLLCAEGAVAGDPPAFPEFTFKRVGVPAAGAKRITVQIEPKIIVPQVDATPETSDAGDQSAYAWYWDAVSPDLADAVPGRLEAAVLELSKGPGVPAPRLQALQRIAEGAVTPAGFVGVIIVLRGGQSSPGSDRVMLHLLVGRLGRAWHCCH